MNTKKLFIGGIVGGIVYFLLGWVAYGKILAVFFGKHHGITTGYMRDPSAMPLVIYLILGNLLMGFLFTYIFIKAKVSSLGSGLVMGATIGFILTSALDCVSYATTTLMSRQGSVADIIAGTCMAAITGAVIGLLGVGKDN